VRQALVWSDWFRLGLLGGALLMSLLFPDNFFHTQSLLILSRYPGYRHYSAPGNTRYQATELMHGSRDLILVTII